MGQCSYASWFRAALSQHFFGGDLESIHFWRVVDVARFDVQQVAIFHGFGLTCPKHLIYSLTPECVDAVLNSTVFASADSMSHKLLQWLQDGLLVGGRTPRPNSVLELPHPVSILVADGAWHDLAVHVLSRCVLDAHFRALWSTLSDRGQAWRHHRGHGAVEDGLAPAGAGALDPRMFQDLACHLRSCAAEGNVDEKFQELKPVLASYCMWLDTCAKQMSVTTQYDFAWETFAGRGGRWHGDVGRHGRYAPLFMI